ncbi:hypothetical protein E4U42_007489 [Claviceps africana]|uniref:Vacuolar segregation protein 7 n=1 Tax=Claviceps africana TaxID=83212 RepID=A0A8K0JAZ3_9HYPO|nr:hypothetical protein E4U42_007489 [Claviceps africana]
MDKHHVVMHDIANSADPSGIKTSSVTNKGDASRGRLFAQPGQAAAGAQTSRRSSEYDSISQSAVTSRDGSPSRQPRRTTSSTPLGSSRSRNNSQPESSPTRHIRHRSQDQVATIRALSASTTPSLPPNAREPPIHAPVPQSPSAIPDPTGDHRWPASPPLCSPSPQLAGPRVTTPTGFNEKAPPAINVQEPSPRPRMAEATLAVGESDTDEPCTPSESRGPLRGLLETVQEVGQNNPQSGDAAFLEQFRDKPGAPESHSDNALSDGGRTLKSKNTMSSQPNGTHQSIIRPDARRPSSVPPSAPPPLVSRPSTISTKPGKSKQETGLTQSMTVETETVASIPQVVLSAGNKDSGSGTLRAKPSTETIKPRKEKKKVARKQPVVNSGAASSKADNFEAKIASAVDEANTSDSEETFVYDSNPPDNTERSNRRFHSRTPSATSMVSQADRQNLRSIYGVMEGGLNHGPVPKKSMKFVNTFGGGNLSDGLTPGDEDGKGSGRSAGGSARGTTRHHHHIGRWGRQPGNGHASLFDNESPFPNAAKSKYPSTSNLRNPSAPPSPRNFLTTRGHLHPKRSTMQMSSNYDLDDTTGADDERTPLIGTLRPSRGHRNRRGPHNLRQAESQTYTRRSSYLNRFAACLVLTMMLLLVTTGAIGFMFATSQPMTDIEIVSIKNVVTSEQVLMFDLTVKAHNPNIVPVSIDHADLEIFAKSEHGGTDSDWRKQPDASSGDFHTLDDPANDPPKTGPGAGDSDDDSRPNFLLGRIAEFDSPLAFEGSIFYQGTSASTGQMQLPSPGNGTAGGSERWELIYQNEFDLIVKGVVKYSLPLSAHIRSATVSGRTTVKPNSANDPPRGPNSTTLNT